MLRVTFERSVFGMSINLKLKISITSTQLPKTRLNNVF